MRAGELCAGYGGLALAVEEVFGATPAWFCEFEEAPSKILAHHWPNVVNYGDMTQVNWSKAEQVQIMSGGTPCQDLSHAGKRKGMTEGTRSNLWVHMREAIAIQRPLYVVWENVRGAYSADADSDLEFCPGCMGEAGRGKSVLRALGRVLGDLSDLGYDVQWRGLRAADVGAPHGRYRVFVLARRRDTVPNSGGIGGDQALKHHGSGATADNRTGLPNESGRQPDGSGPVREATQDANLAAGGQWRHSASGQAESGRAWPDAGGRSGASSADAESVRRRERRAQSARKFWGLASARNRASFADTDGRDDDGRIRDAQRGQEQREATAGSREGSFDAAHAASDPWRQFDGDDVPVAWGDYEPAIRRWEHVIGRRAPRPTEPSDAWLKMIAKRRAGLDKRPVGMRGSIAPAQRLSPRFTEWMMGLPNGWVTDPDIGISRNEQLKACGNGVVPQQAVAALRDMLRAFQTEGISA